MTSLSGFLMSCGYPKGLAYKYERCFDKGVEIPEDVLLAISSYYYSFLQPFMDKRLHDYFVSYAKEKGLI